MKWIVLVLAGLAFLSACAPRPVRTDPLAGIAEWSQLPETRSTLKQFSQSSLGIILSDNVEQQIKAYRESLNSFGRSMNSQQFADDNDFISGAQLMTSMLQRNFRRLSLINDLNECVSSRLDYCAIIDWNLEWDGWSSSFNTTLQLFLLNSKAERIAVFKNNSGWQSAGFFDEGSAGIVESEKIAISLMEMELKRISH